MVWPSYPKGMSVAFPDDVLFANHDLRVRWVDGRVLLEQRGVVLLWIGLVFLVITAAAVAGAPLAGHMNWALTDTERLALDVLGWVAGVGSLIMFAVGWRRSAAEPTCFDLPEGVLRVGARTIGLSSIERIFLEHRTQAGTDLVGIAVEVGGEDVSLIPPQQATQAHGMLVVLAQLQQIVADAGHTVSDDILPREDRRPRVDHTIAIALAVTGLLWTIAGLLFGRSWRFVLDDTNGLLVWPFGLWLLGIGIAERAGAPVIDTMTSGKWRYRVPLLLLLAGSYLLLCLRPLGA